MGCTFCATGTMGIIGNLSTGEILEQLLHAGRLERIRNVVFMVSVRVVRGVCGVSWVCVGAAKFDVCAALAWNWWVGSWCGVMVFACDMQHSAVWGGLLYARSNNMDLFLSVGNGGDVGVQ